MYILRLYLQANFHTHLKHHRSKRAAASSDDPHAAHESHTVLEELTHIFHIGSMAILSALVLEVGVNNACLLFFINFPGPCSQKKSHSAGRHARIFVMSSNK